MTSQKVSSEIDCQANGSMVDPGGFEIEDEAGDSALFGCRKDRYGPLQREPRDWWAWGRQLFLPLTRNKFPSGP